jgi:hypothetical protein
MSFKIKLNNITVPSGNQFKVFYKLDSRTPGSVASQGDNAWGTLYGTYTGGTTTNIEIDFLPITSNPYGKQHWFKILDTVTGSYIIENIYIHEYEYYTACLSTPTPTPTPTSTPTPTPTPTPTVTNTPIPTDTPTPTPTPEVTNTPTPTPTPEPTDTPTPTPTTLCDAPTLSGVTLSSGSVFTLNYGTPTNCTALTLSFSRDQVTWTNSTGGCTTGRQVDTSDATGTWYFRLTQICSVGEGNSNVVSYTYSTPTPTPTATATPTPTPTSVDYPGDCYEMVFPASATTFNGQTLYICYQKTDNSYVCWPYSQFQDSGANSPNITVNICSKVLPSIKYGASGEQLIPDASFNVTMGEGCTTSVDCGGNDPTPPPPPPTQTPIPDDSGLCYTYTLTSGEAQLYSGLTVTYTPLGTLTPLNVSVTNGVEYRDNLDGTYTYYICSKTTPQIYDGQTGIIAFAIDQNGACDYENNCQNPILPPTPTPTPCPADGTFISSTCDGTTLVVTYANGSCGTRTESTPNDSGCSDNSGGTSGGY